MDGIKEKMQYDISVIVPVYNAEKYIAECIESILNQTKDGIQIIIVNDGSTDSTPEIISQYAKDNQSVKIVNQSNQGLAGARITGLKNATAKYIGWVDADDFVDPQMYEILYSIAETQDADYVYCDYAFYPEKVATKEKWFKEYTGVKDWNYIERNTQCWNSLTKRSLIEKIHLTDTYLHFEEYSWISVMLNAEKVVSTNEVLYFYRVDNNSMSGGSFLGKTAHFEKGVQLSAGLKDILIGTGYEKELAEYMDYRYIYTLLQLLIVSSFNRKRDTYEKARHELFALKFKKNKYTKLILDNNHGSLKSFIIRNLIPLSYTTARMITSIVFS